MLVCLFAIKNNAGKMARERLKKQKTAKFAKLGGFH
jgi:hypothetical protein